MSAVAPACAGVTVTPECEPMHSPSREVPTHDAGGAVNSRPALGASMDLRSAHAPTLLRASAAFVRACAARLIATGTVLLATTGLALAQVATPVGTTIRNTAT